MSRSPDRSRPSKLKGFWDETAEPSPVDLVAQRVRAENARRFAAHLARCPRASRTS